jgi:hypothetical protein
MNQMNRRSFLQQTAILATGALALKHSTMAAHASVSNASLPHVPIEDGLPAKPMENPLPWRSIADSFDSYIMEPTHTVLLQRANGKPGFASALEGKTDGGLTTYGPIVLGKILRGDDVGALIPSLEDYFSEEYGIFQDGLDATLCEYWYLMNINALAGGIIRTKLSTEPVWTGRLRRSLERLIDLAKQVHYDFNDQGYDFKAHKPFTVKDIYRQPDAIAGYSYLMLFGYEFFGDQKFLDESRAAMSRYEGCARNPWYEIPSGAMGSLAAARLSTLQDSVDLRKALRFVFDDKIGLMRTGTWGGKEVNGLMAGFSTEPPDQAYSMESMVVMPYVLPVLRYRPDYASDIGRYALNAITNLRYFYSDYLPKENQSRPELPSAFPYERLDKTLKGKSPYAAGDYDSHRSVYGGAYAMWLGEMILPTTEPKIPQINVSRTDFLEARSHPTYLLYNPFDDARTVPMTIGGSKSDVYDLRTHRVISRGVSNSVAVALERGEARVLVVVPAGAKRDTKKGVVSFNGVPVDYRYA